MSYINEVFVFLSKEIDEKIIAGEPVVPTCPPGKCVALPTGIVTLGINSESAAGRAPALAFVKNNDGH